MAQWSTVNSGLSYPRSDSNISQFSDEDGNALPTCIPKIPEFAPMDRRQYLKQTRRAGVERRLHDIASLFHKYDENGDGVLQRDELHQLLRDLGGGMPTLDDDEIDYVMKSADSNDDGVIQLDELPRAVQLWQGYLDHKDEIESIMVKYDTNQDGVLQRYEVRSMLADLKGGPALPTSAITEAEVDEVMRAADVSRTGDLSAREAVFAVAFHYSYDDKPTPVITPVDKSLPAARPPPPMRAGRGAQPARRAAPGGGDEYAACVAGGDAVVREVTDLFMLHKAGALTAAEFSSAKAGVL